MGSTVGSKIAGSQQPFLTETVICIVERWKKSMGYRFVSKCNHAQESHTLTSILFSAILEGPLFVEIPTFCYHGKVKHLFSLLKIM